MVTLGDVVLVGYGSGDYPKLRLARIIKLLPSFAINQKFRIRLNEFYKKYFVTFVRDGLDKLEEYKNKEGI